METNFEKDIQERAVSSSGNTDVNRSCSSGNNVFMLERSSNDSYIECVLMHELNYQYGAPDHYHEPTVPGDDTTCKFKDICSTCGDNPRDRNCVMNSTLQEISSDTIICDDCINDIKAHLSKHH